MDAAALPGVPGDHEGCAFILDADGDEPAARQICANTRSPGSSYCARHHTICHLPRDSAAEARHLRAIERLATAVGGRRAAPAGNPSERFLSRLERLVGALP